MVGKIVKTEGFLSLYTGLFATYLKILPSTALAFAIVEKLKILTNSNYWIH